MTGNLPTAQLRRREMVVYTAILSRAPQPVTWQALALLLWPRADDEESRTEKYVSRYVSMVRNALGADSIITVNGSYSLGTAVALPVPTFFTPRTTAKETREHIRPARNEVVKIDTAAFIAAQAWAQSQRPSAAP